MSECGLAPPAARGTTGVHRERDARSARRAKQDNNDIPLLDNTLWQSSGFWIGVLIVALTAAALAGRWIRRARHRRHVKRARKAVRAEKGARRVLERAGYDVEETQARTEWTVLCDGAPQNFDLRADYIVVKGRRRWVAEVKSGDLVTGLRHGATRRQLLEYQLAYDVDGVLLVDMKARRVREVSFPVLD